MVERAYRPLAEAHRAAGLRSFSVGDVLQIGGTWLACAAAGWVELDQAPRMIPVPDAPVDMLVVTPAGEVRDYTVVAEPGGLVTTRSVLEALYDQIGCTAVDVVQLSPEIDMWVDDDGALKPQVRVNQLASYIATRFGLPFQLYVGVAVFTGGVDQAGNTMSLCSPARKAVLSLIAELRTIPWR